VEVWIGLSDVIVLTESYSVNYITSSCIFTNPIAFSDGQIHSIQVLFSTSRIMVG